MRIHRNRVTTAVAKKHMGVAFASLLLAGGAVLGAGGVASAAPQAGHHQGVGADSGDHGRGHGPDRGFDRSDGHRPPTVHAPRSRDGRDPCALLPGPGDPDFYRWDHGVSLLCDSGRGVHQFPERDGASRQIVVVRPGAVR
ncbi:hypothetical protein EV284_0676 [Streptomyces sp. BK022]|uniref:hypothetical protein n=1 Tax=Streptomyces sp. BK022 TaxID=2512123 RepID=UPI00102A02CA|nr:hypothetical protein [Streptomyces sp. BK022]RZU46025.1 hypothetical protein EV284_0676 [Streptomyces sp. BK022]